MYKPCPCCHSLSFDFYHLHCSLILKYVFRMLKVMMIQNIAVDQRFANGTQGRLLHWHPTETESKRKALPAYSQDLLVRFCKESALSKTELMPGIRFLLNPLSNTVHYCDAASLTEYPSLSNLQTKTRHRLHGPWRETRELACQRRADHATAVRCPCL